MVGGVAEGSAEGTDGHVDAVVEIDVRVVGPELFLDLLAGGDAPIILDQQPEDPERLLPQQDTLAHALGSGRPQLAGDDIDLEVAQAYPSHRCLLLPAGVMGEIYGACPPLAIWPSIGPANSALGGGFVNWFE